MEIYRILTTELNVFDIGIIKQVISYGVLSAKPSE